MSLRYRHIFTGAESVQDIDKLLLCLKNPDQATAAAECLVRLGWKPGSDENAAYYWALGIEVGGVQAYQKCREIGAPALHALMLKATRGNLFAKKASLYTIQKIVDSGRVPESEFSRLQGFAEQILEREPETAHRAQAVLETLASRRSSD